MRQSCHPRADKKNREPMKIAIDFGTSYSAAGVMRHGTIELVRFGNEHQFRTAAYFPLELPARDAFNPTPEVQAQIERSVNASMAEQERAQARRADHLREAARLPEPERSQQIRMAPTAPNATRDQYLRIETEAARRQWYAEMLAAGAPLDLRDAVFGEPAIDAYLADQNGRIVVSPKSMLGYNLTQQNRNTVLGILSKVLGHIRTHAENEFGEQISKALIGRPVKFRSTLGEAGTMQALDITTEAALAAGFEEVDFMEEPIAAAWEYHTSLAQPTTALIVDIGGGTTDVALANLGTGLIAPEILNTWGIPMGGTDIDLNLSLTPFLGVFGRGQPDIPNHLTYAAAVVDQLHRQQEFRQANFTRVDPPYRQRLNTLQSHGATHRLNRAVERSKILLSREEEVRADLGFIEPQLSTDVNRGHLTAAAEPLLNQLSALLERIKADHEHDISAIYVTGGASRAHYIHQALATVFDGVPIVQGEASLAVVKGLARAGSQLAAR